MGMPQAPSATSSGHAPPASSPPARASHRPFWRIFSIAKNRHKSLLRILAAAFALVGATAFLAAHLTRNYTASLPLGIYVLRPDLAVAKGATVDLAIPAAIRPLISERGYLPLEARDFRLLKNVVALPGDHVCFVDGRYEVNGIPISPIAPRDSLGRPLSPFHFCGPVPVGTAFVATAPPSSLDSRYFGPVPLSELTVAKRLWTF
jgi:conjugative transfer signal peptidase TraF